MTDEREKPTHEKCPPSGTPEHKAFNKQQDQPSTWDWTGILLSLGFAFSGMMMISVSSTLAFALLGSVPGVFVGWYRFGRVKGAIVLGLICASLGALNDLFVLQPALERARAK